MRHQEGRRQRAVLQRAVLRRAASRRAATRCAELKRAATRRAARARRRCVRDAVWARAGWLSGGGGGTRATWEACRAPRGRAWACAGCGRPGGKGRWQPRTARACHARVLYSCSDSKSDEEGCAHTEMADGPLRPGDRSGHGTHRGRSGNETHAAQSRNLCLPGSQVPRGVDAPFYR